MMSLCVVLFFFQAEDGIRDLVRSRGLGDVYKRQVELFLCELVVQGGALGAISFGHAREMRCRIVIILSLIHI